MGEFLKNLAMALLPVPVKGETEDATIFRWRQSVAIAIIILGAVMIVFIVAAIGWLSFGGQGISGFAFASDVQVLIEQGKATRIVQIESAITQDRTLQCQAIMEGNQSAMNYSYFHLQGDVDQYTSIPPHIVPRIPTCDELIPAASGVRAPTPTPSAGAAQGKLGG